MERLYVVGVEFGEEDERGWVWNNERDFTVKSYYEEVAKEMAWKGLPGTQIIDNFPHIKGVAQNHP